MSNQKDSSKSQNPNKISICEVMKDDTSKVIQKLESQIPANFQQYSDLYTAYLHTLDDIFGTCYISEKEFFDKLNIDQGILKAYQQYSHSFTEAYLSQLDMWSKIKEQNIQTQKTNLKVYDHFMHSMMDSYAKFLSTYNKTSTIWFNPKNFENP